MRKMTVRATGGMDEKERVKASEHKKGEGGERKGREIKAAPLQENHTIKC